jgi:hypothetical protein
MEISTSAAAAFGVALSVTWFLLGWGAKHLLDRTALPRILDAWARHSKKKAERRAEELQKQFQKRLSLATDTRMLIIPVVSGATVLVLWATMVVAFFAWLTFVYLYEQPSGAAPVNRTLMQLLVTFPLLIFAAGLHNAYWSWKLSDLVENLPEQWIKLIDRLRRLLSPHLQPEALEEFLQRVPAVPSGSVGDQAAKEIPEPPKSLSPPSAASSS